MEGAGRLQPSLATSTESTIDADVHEAVGPGNRAATTATDLSARSRFHVAYHVSPSRVYTADESHAAESCGFVGGLLGRENSTRPAVEIVTCAAASPPTDVGSDQSMFALAQPVVPT